MRYTRRPPTQHIIIYILYTQNIKSVRLYYKRLKLH